VTRASSQKCQKNGQVAGVVAVLHDVGCEKLYLGWGLRGQRDGVTAVYDASRKREKSEL